MLIIADSKIPNAEIAFTPFGEVRSLPTKQMTHENIKHATAILVRSETTIDESLLNGTHVRFVGTATIGTDHVDSDYLQQHDISFASCPGSNANSVAEYVLAALLEVSHRLEFSLKGKTLGVVGHGNTGSLTAKKAQAIGMNVLHNDPPLARATGDARYLPLNALMDADIISLHVPLTMEGEDATYHLLDEKRLAKMKRGSILINTSRGAVVETEALKHTLKSDHLRACVLDVWEGEPDIDVELLSLVTLGTPHIAGYSHDGKLNATVMLRQSLADFLKAPTAGPSNLREGALQTITLSSQAHHEELARAAVKQCYDIEADDKKLRRLSLLPQSDRANFFRRLRAEYPMRREFQNHFVETDSLDHSSKQLLREIGFVVQPTHSSLSS